MISLFSGTDLPGIQEAIAGALASKTEYGTIKPGFGIAWI
jgi:hypothetical protein